MALKTFNIDEEIYEEFSKHCKKNGISMSKKIENFIKEEMKKLEMGLKKMEHASVEHGSEHLIKEHSFMKYC